MLNWSRWGPLLPFDQSERFHPPSHANSQTNPGRAAGITKRASLALVQHTENRIHQHGTHASRNRDFPANVHKLVIAKAGKRSAEPDHQVDEARHLQQEPEEA